ncbi:hypothetical protein ACHAWF_008488 [Thalassiosira exigua]
MGVHSLVSSNSNVMVFAAHLALLLLAAVELGYASSPLPAKLVTGRPFAFCTVTNRRSWRHPKSVNAILTRKASSKKEAEQLAEGPPSSSESGNKMGTWNPFSLAVLKLGFTEPAWTSPLNYKKADGTYLCANCNTPLFSSSGKYDSGSGWPSFWKTIADNRVALEREWDGRVECKCAECGGHLGHIFPDGPTRGSLDANELDAVPKSDPQIGYKVQNNGGVDAKSEYSRMPRFCVNGIALRFEEKVQ